MCGRHRQAPVEVYPGRGSFRQGALVSTSGRLGVFVHLTLPCVDSCVGAPRPRTSRGVRLTIAYGRNASTIHSIHIHGPGLPQVPFYHVRVLHGPGLPTGTFLSCTSTRSCLRPPSRWTFMLVHHACDLMLLHRFANALGPSRLEVSSVSTHIYTQHSKESPSRAKSCSALVTKCVYLTPHVQPESASESMQQHKIASEVDEHDSPSGGRAETSPGPRT